MECKRCLCVCFWITLLVCRPCVLFVETIYDLYIYRRDNLTIPEVYYFAVGTKNGVTIGLEGACKGEQRRLKMPLSKWQKDGNISLPAFSSFLMFTNMSEKMVDITYRTLVTIPTKQCTFERLFLQQTIQQSFMMPWLGTTFRWRTNTAWWSSGLWIGVQMDS